jgi:hypothetical protein
MRLFSKRTARWSSLLAATALLLVACEPEVSVDPRTDYWAGTWTCNEQTGDLAPQVYTVEVDLGADPDGVTLSGLYNQGLNFTAVGTVNGSTLSGTGSYSILTDRVTYTLNINDGGSTDFTTGTWTR